VRVSAHVCGVRARAICEILCCTARISTCSNTFKVTKICDDKYYWNQTGGFLVHLLNNVYDIKTHRENYVSYSQVEHSGRKEKFSPLWKIFCTLYCSTFLYVSQCFPPSQLHYSWWAVLSIKLVSLLNVAAKFYVHDQLHLLFPLFPCFWTHSVAHCCFSLLKSTSCKCVTWKEHDVKTVIRNLSVIGHFGLLIFTGVQQKYVTITLISSPKYYLWVFVLQLSCLFLWTGFSDMELYTYSFLHYWHTTVLHNGIPIENTGLYPASTRR
jgi:hypothetical protein